MEGPRWRWIEGIGIEKGMTSWAGSTQKSGHEPPVPRPPKPRGRLKGGEASKKASGELESSSGAHRAPSTGWARRRGEIRPKPVIRRGMGASGKRPVARFKRIQVDLLTA